MQVLLNILLSGLAVFVSGRIIPGVMIDGFGTSVIVAIILAVVNAFIKPILFVLTLPINILTLGLFSLVINALMVLLVNAIVPGFEVNGLLAALLFSIVLSIVSTVLFTLTK